jgi:hypothetical protein
MIRLLVCGGRAYGSGPGEADFLRAELDGIAAKQPILCLIHGGQTGADTLADLWAGEHLTPAFSFPVTMADWAEHGRAAGPKRNARMIKEGRPDLVLAFPGNRGTRDMVRQARRAGIPVAFAGWSG